MKVVDARNFFASVCAVALLGLAGCASGAQVKSQAYAQLRNQRTFEFGFPAVWKAIESTMHHYKITDRDPEEADALEMKKLSRRTLETDWFYAQSRDKYQEYQANGSPRKVYLQTRLKYQIDARRTLGGTDVTVKVDEEVERLKNDGSSDGYAKVESPDPSRANEILDRINNSLLSGAP